MAPPPMASSQSAASVIHSNVAGYGDSAIQDLPFVVTHWLANFSGGDANGPDDAQRRQAIEKIRRATSEIASAFTALGAFGTTIPPSFGASFAHEARPQNATYSDIRRQWSAVAPSHLEHLAQAVASTNTVAQATATNSVQANLLEAAGEARDSVQDQGGGRTLQEAINLDVKQGEGQETTGITKGESILHSPILLGRDAQSNGTTVVLSGIDAERPASPAPMLPAHSSFATVGKNIAGTMRKYLEKRETVRSTRIEMKRLNVSIIKQASSLEALNQKYERLAEGADMTKMLEVSDEVKTGKQDCERVTAQLKRKLLDLSTILHADEHEIVRLEKETKMWESRRKEVVTGFRDPFGSWPGPMAPNHSTGTNPVLQSIIGRQQGLSRSLKLFMPCRSSILEGAKEAHFVATRRALLVTRLSHATTINTHLSYPVYCLRFDRTGRYFITGADDYLIKIFYLGAGQSCCNKSEMDGSRSLRCNYGANLRGAVLVCSLRGHAGVINDIDVSSDNAFLATASVDGDVRVWGLKDGSPVAILRGHKGGANMVSWSKLTPFRLVSTGSDGFARMWDIREACLKRYSASVGKRPEYRLKLTANEKAGDEKEIKTIPPEPMATPGIAPLPPLPVRDTSQAAAAVDPPQNPNDAISVPNPIIVPPLPHGVAPLPVGGPSGGDEARNQNVNPQGQIAPPGQFEANAAMDEGVKLLSKYKHGSVGPEIVGPGTRSRRAAVNVICVARCPIGGHFTTGSDDGICRVFADNEEGGVAIVDKRASERCFSVNVQQSKRSTRSSDEPILKLMGHVSPITDLAYSYAGDRLLSASQKDGVVRLWSLGTRVLERNTGSEGGVAQIVVKLTDPGSSATRNKPRSSRRAPGGSTRNEISKVSCDVAVWTHEDSKIITSQSVLVKQSGSEIQPGSQYLFLWDSRSGQCLMGISGAHTMQCPVVIPHPNDASIVCTAAADGIAKVWDWGSGRCIFTHHNKLEFGPVEAADRNKLAGYLDGSFSPDGGTIVLTDDSGRLTILDSGADKGCSEGKQALMWMREQYFANDYYELFYDRSGYCIERGSEQPPHLAPRGVRCNHSGSPFSDEVNETFSKLVGPSPLPGRVCRWQRDEIRTKATVALESEEPVAKRLALKVRRGVREFDPSSTILIKASGHIDDRSKQIPRNPMTSEPQAGPGNSGAASGAASSRTMSANWQYLDYDDMMREQGNDDADLDSGDEEFNPSARNMARPENMDESDDEMDLDELEAESPFRPTSRSSRQQPDSGQRRQRAQRRTQRRDNQFVELDSDDELIAQYMSTNNAPSGPYLEDYTSVGHFWRMTTNGNVRRKWLKRIESDTSYEGRKIYTPQLGDSIIYIPRAHYETFSDFPSLEPPWQHWPQGTDWPVVRCCVRGIRFRFPYEDYYRASQSICNSIVAILTLEVTGIPEISEDRDFPWPKPSFVESTRAFVFEVSVFENDKCEFVFPEGLYTERLRSLESALRGRSSADGLPVSVYYNTNGTEDAVMEAYQGEIAEVLEEESPSNAHLFGSGFGVVSVNMPNSYADLFSPWDIAMGDLSIARPHLSDEDKKLVLENLNIQTRKESVAEHLSMPVDSDRYSDYDRMVEVDTNLMFIKRRLTADYYASKLSVVGDLRLVKDNCIKYNGVENDLARVATVMYQDFEANVLSSAERSFLISEEEFLKLSRSAQATVEARQVPRVRLRLRQRTNQVTAQNHQASSNSSEYTLRGRDRLRRQSSLENLPAPEEAPTRRRGLRNNSQSVGGRRTRSMDTSANENEGNGQRRSLRSRGQAPTLESLSRISGGQADQPTNVAQNDAVPQRPRRASSRRAEPNNDEVEGEDEEEEQVQPTPPRRRNARSTRSSVQGNSESHIEDREEVTPQRTGREARRQTRAVTSMEQEEDSESRSNESDEESRDSEDESIAGSETASPPQRRKRSRTTVPTSTPTRARRPTVFMHNDESPTRRSNRSSEKMRSTYEEVPSDFDPDENEESDQSESESEEEESNGRGRSRQVQSYAELPSDFEDEGDLSDDENEPRPSKASPRKRQASTRSTSPQSKKRTKTSEPFPTSVNLNEWPIVEMKDITPICKAMLTRLAEEDRGGLFVSPVLESFPHIKGDYLKVVQTPMDLRTIEEDRIHKYKNITELQDDLILVFRNCCAFNGTASDLGQEAMTIWMQLNVIFLEICKEMGIMLSRRWKP